MADTITVEIIGLADSSCSPFPCDETRTCGLSECQPSGKIITAFEVLKKVIGEEYGDRVKLSLILVDNGIPDRIKKIVEAEHPPLPMILVNGRLTRIGRIAVDRIKKEIDASL